MDDSNDRNEVTERNDSNEENEVTERRRITSKGREYRGYRIEGKAERLGQGPFSPKELTTTAYKKRTLQNNFVVYEQTEIVSGDEPVEPFFRKSFVDAHEAVDDIHADIELTEKTLRHVIEAVKADHPDPDEDDNGGD